MIKRAGFVSNSSSSSFVVTFPKKPETKEELHDMMKMEQRIVDVVWNDIQRLQPHTGSIIGLGDGDDLDGSYDFCNAITRIIEDEIFLGTEWVDREEGLIQEKDLVKRLIMNLQQRLDGLSNIELPITYTVKFHYSDEGGEGWLEHGDIFRNLPNERISHH